jgi:iron complex outermembrane receptor protein
MLDFVTFTQRDSSEQRLWDVSANVTGNLFELPGGPLGLAFGAEHRDQRGSFRPDPIVAAGEGSDISALPTSGRFNVDELYAELNAPLLADRPVFNLLELNGAVRWSNYSTSGSTTTFKAGLNWKPVRDLRLRATWAQGFRAPSIGELFGTPSRFDQTVTDPCSDLNNSGASAEVRANCIASGVPSNGSYVQINPQLSVITGGNTALKPETSKSWVVGAVYSPSAIPRLSVEANYFNIKLDGAIQAIAAQTLLARCANTGDALSCATINRTSTGALVFIEGLLQNIAGIETDGIDVTFNYRTPQIIGGNFGLFWTNSFLRNYTLIVPATVGTTEIEREGTEQGSPDQAFPKHKSTAIFDWDAKDWGLSLTGRYISKVIESQNDNKLGSRFYVDAQARLTPQSWGDRFGFAAGVNNLFDRDPPGCISCGLNNFDPTTYDVPGRYFYARVNVKL